MGESPAKTYAIVVGAVLVFAGVAGFFYETDFSTNGDKDAVFGILDVNGWHNLVHVATGALGLVLSRTLAGARTYALLLGVVYLAVAIWGFVLGDGEFILSILPVNTEDNVLHLLISLTGFGAYAASPAVGQPVAVH
jgi:uncharacterized protein DUF4383